MISYNRKCYREIDAHPIVLMPWKKSDMLKHLAKTVLGNGSSNLKL